MELLKLLGVGDWDIFDPRGVEHLGGIDKRCPTGVDDLEMVKALCPVGVDDLDGILSGILDLEEDTMNEKYFPLGKPHFFFF